MSSSSEQTGTIKQSARMAATKNGRSEGKSGKMHRRSRSGCFTCRLRRKKCEEGKPACKACRQLGLQCNYKRPMWWSNGEQRRAQKESIKNAIKNTQLSKKSAQQTPQQPQQLPSTTPPGLSHSIPTSSEYYPESMPETRRPSMVSPFSGFEIPQFSPPHGYPYDMPPPPQPPLMPHPQYPMFAPYEVDIKTERQIYVNDVETRRDSTISTFSTYQPPPSEDGMAPFPDDSWIQSERHESLQESFTEEPLDFNFFQFPNGTMSPNHESVINVDECDSYLLNHFVEKVLKLIFPILNTNQHGSASQDVILPGLEKNTAYRHCCLSIAATHMKATEGISGERIDNDIIRHRYAAVTELCEALSKDTEHDRILEATLGMIFFQCSVGRPDDVLPDIPWHQHFEAVTNLVLKLDLPAIVTNLVGPGHPGPPFNMALTSWIDILGSTMLGRSPVFADTYRELNFKGANAGLSELMGCDDRVMFLISEIACLDAQKPGLDEVMLCGYVEHLARAIAATEAGGQPESCFSETGALRPKQLGANITRVFTIAARIYLCSLVPGYEPRGVSMCSLTADFSNLMNFIPAGPDGFDRSLVWPLLISGAQALHGSPFRTMFADRCEQLGDAAQFGSFGRISELLKDIWQINDAASARGEHRGVHWRDVMAQKGWDFLLI